MSASISIHSQVRLAMVLALLFTLSAVSAAPNPTPDVTLYVVPFPNGTASALPGVSAIGTNGNTTEYAVVSTISTGHPRVTSTPYTTIVQSKDLGSFTTTWSAQTSVFTDTVSGQVVTTTVTYEAWTQLRTSFGEPTATVTSYVKPFTTDDHIVSTASFAEFGESSSGRFTSNSVHVTSSEEDCKFNITNSTGVCVDEFHGGGVAPDSSTTWTNTLVPVYTIRPELSSGQSSSPNGAAAAPMHGFAICGATIMILTILAEC